MATKLYDRDWVASAFQRIAEQIRSDPVRGEGQCIIGVRTRGAAMADRLARLLSPVELSVPVGYIDPTMFRDDLHTGRGLKAMQATEIDFDINDKAITLCDDVLLTGRTIRAAMESLFQYGRPACIRLCCMVDRGGRELPIQPDFTGARIDVPRGGWVRVKLLEVDDREDAVYVLAPGDSEP